MFSCVHRTQELCAHTLMHAVFFYAEAIFVTNREACVVVVHRALLLYL